MSHRTVTTCGLCASINLETVLSLATTPATCVMVAVGAHDAEEEHHPLELLRCRDCGLVQLGAIVAPNEVFPPDYPYSSGNSPGLHQNFADLALEAEEMVGGLDHMDLVVDVGANDGTLLGKFLGRCRAVGVEPTKQALRIAGATAYQEFFTADLARKIREQHGPAKAVTACNVLAHVDDIRDVMEGIRILLADDGVLVAENHDLASVVNGQWDTVYHEHLRFYSPRTFYETLIWAGFAPRSWHAISTHGGSFRMIATADGAPMRPPGEPEYDFEALRGTVDQTREAIRAAVAGGAVGIGATARATTIINTCGLDVEDLAYVCEVARSDKIGHYIPGTLIPVVNEQRLFEDQPQVAVLFSWHLADAIVPKLRSRGYEGRIVVPLPEVRSV